MSGVSSWHILRQGPVLGALGRTAVRALGQQTGLAPGRTPQLPGPEFRRQVTPPPRSLVDAFVRYLGGDPRSYRGTLPPHLFPQWGFPLAARTLEGLPYPLLRVVNGGCRMEIHAPLPDDRPLELRARLESVSDDGRRAVLRQRVVTGTAELPDALVCELRAVVPLARGREGGASKGRRESPRAPDEAREIARIRLPRDAGLSFAKLTGDFNPIHWIPPYARTAGFRDVILHGFATLAYVFESLGRNRFGGDVTRLRMLDVRFTRPLVLPADVGFYVRDDEVFVADALGGPAYLTGSFASAPLESNHE